MPCVMIALDDELDLFVGDHSMYICQYDLM